MSFVRDNAKFTVLQRPKGQWSPEEVEKILRGLMAEASGAPGYPEHVVLHGEFDKALIENLLGPAEEFEHKIVTGYDSPDLPFAPIML